MASSSTFFQFNLSTKYKRQIALDMIAENLLVFCVLILGTLSIKALKNENPINMYKASSTCKASLTPI